MLNSVARTICVVVLFSFLLNFCTAHTEEDVRRGKEKWFKQPDDIAGHGHDHGHHHHDHGHVHDHHHGHDHVHHHHGHDHGHHHHGHDHVHHHHEDSHGHHHHEHTHTHEHAHKQAKPTKKARSLTETIDMWWQALFATVLISAAPFVILYAVPLESDAEKYQPLLKVLLSFASGGLLGDAFLHLIPHAISPHSHGEDGEHHHHHHDEHDHSASTAVGMWVMAGVVAFLWIEKVVRLMQGGEGCHHHHAHQEEKEEQKEEAEETTSEEKKSDDSSDGELRKRNVKGQDDGSTEEKAEDEEKIEEKKETAEVVEEEKPMKVAGYLNLAADFFHNFTDGLAIGASFLGGQKLGFITTLTILFHEVPHEIGDFAILVQSGCDKKKAMWLQLSTATGAMLGCVIGLLAENVGEATTSWILPFTAGGFIYIATVSVIPELLKETSDLKQTVKEISAMLMGIGMMVIIAMLEH